MNWDKKKKSKSSCDSDSEDDSSFKKCTNSRKSYLFLW